MVQKAMIRLIYVTDDGTDDGQLHEHPANGRWDELFERWKAVEEDGPESDSYATPLDFAKALGRDLSRRPDVRHVRIYQDGKERLAAGRVPDRSWAKKDL